MKMGKTSKKHKKHKKSSKKHSDEKYKSKNVKKSKKSSKSTETEKSNCKSPRNDLTVDDNYDIPLDLMFSKSHAPETPEEYKKKQSHIRHEVDPVTGRQRLIKGDGEVLEEIVTRKRHVQINKQATQGDGKFFQEHTTG